MTINPNVREMTPEEDAELSAALARGERVVVRDASTVLPNGLGYVRIMFELWMMDGVGNPALAWDSDRSQYIDPQTDAMWEAWQGALDAIGYRPRHA